MEFTREPIIETIITPKDGYKLVVRSSKGVTQEEYFLEAVQIVSYGNAFFFRSTELPKSFLVPVSDYELVEVREARIALKNAAPDRAIKIGGGREASLRSAREPVGRESSVRETMREPIREPMREPVREPMREPLREPAYSKDFERSEYVEKVSFIEAPTPSCIAAAPSIHDKKRDRRRSARRRRTDLPETEGGEEGHVEENGSLVQSVSTHHHAPSFQAPLTPSYLPEKREFSTSLTSILPPPSKLISDTIHEYRGSELFKDIFHTPDGAIEGIKPPAEASFKNEEAFKSGSTEIEAPFPSGLFFKPPPAPIQESIEEKNRESLPSHQIASEAPALSSSEELGNQQFLFLEVLSQSAREPEKEKVHNQVEQEGLRSVETIPEHIKEERVVSKIVPTEKVEPAVQPSFEEEPDTFKSTDHTPSSSFWPDSFGQSQRQQRGEDDHPLPL